MLKKIWLFRVIMLSIPLLFFAAFEGILRLISFGEEYSLFIENPQAPEYLLPRPDVVKRYFPPGAPAPNVTIEANFFKKKKPENGLRIFVQGGSTAAGFPYGLGASPAGMLDYRLKQSFPDRPVEVISTALSAVNSYTLLDFSDEILAQKPDAILIYAGHNEYLGLLGVGSHYAFASSPRLTRLFLQLRQFRLVKFAQHLYWRLAGNTQGTDIKPSRTVMAEIARHKNIARDSVLFDDGLVQFRSNMRALIEKYQDHGVPVLIATIASNLADQAPFASSKSLQQDSDALLAKLSSQPAGELSDSTLATLDSAVAASASADLHYAFAQVLRALGEHTRAKTHFTQARDHDLLRFRAPSEINSIIVELAEHYKLPLVDANARLEKHATDGIIGEALMLEHVHPTIDGYFLIADAFYHELEQSGVLGQFPRVIDSDSARAEIPVFPAEEYLGRAKIADLVADYPFTDQPGLPVLPPRYSWDDHLGYQAYQKKIGWLQIAAQSMERYRDDPLKYAMAAKLLADAVPDHMEYSYSAGVSLIRAQRSVEAPRYLLRAIDLDPSHISAQLALVHAYLLQQRAKDAKPWVKSILRLDPDNATANEVATKMGIR